MVKDEDDVTYEQINITDDEMLDNDYERVVINDQEENNFEEFADGDVQEIYDTDIEQSTGNWHHNEIRYLIHFWSQLRNQFNNCPNEDKNAVWQILSERMIENGHFFDAFSCENKWCSLKKVYLFNKNHKPENSKNEWPYYNDMDKALNGTSFEISDVDDDEIEECSIENLTADIPNKNDNSDPNSFRGNDKFYWSTDSTRALIKLYGKDKKKFASASQGEKHLLWEDISRQLAQMDFYYPANSSSEMDGIITISLSDDNELIEMKKENMSFDDTGDNTASERSIQNFESNDVETMSSGSLDVWTEAATKQLIQLWGLYRSRFLIAAQGKKRILWNEISEVLRQNGHNYSGIVCDRKWRLLKANYLKRKEKYKKIGTNFIKWQYYQDMDRLLRAPIESVAWSMDSTMCLIESFDRHKDKFMKAATGEKLLIWRQIANEMLQNGYDYTPRACDNKWRTLKNRYNKNKSRAERNKKVVWVYYEKINSVLRDLNKDSKCDKDNKPHDGYNEILESPNMVDENISKTNLTNKVDLFSEIKEMFQTRNLEFDKRLKEMEDNLSKREKMFENLQHQTLEALKKSNELETQKLKLLQQLVSRLPV
ncbi:uncharacterized protein LOC126905970 isoform X2 [Daktulosphaira vitifoliae]|uniref:uncharacterized protein LOC126905970 isoform X2 n=1 Tax=Daktulosphaira vitifoliae TaxID=58002 RepID=UPI0021A99F74|nr:uncharacterized protein LOC126905970 isoform X2 [Daktulosphaira vitifoliae]